MSLIISREKIFAAILQPAKSAKFFYLQNFRLYSSEGEVNSHDAGLPRALPISTMLTITVFIPLPLPSTYRERERERERERYHNPVTQKGCICINICVHGCVHYLGNQAGHLVAVKLIRVITVNINHSHVDSLRYAASLKKKDVKKKDQSAVLSKQGCFQGS